MFSKIRWYWVAAAVISLVLLAIAMPKIPCSVERSKIGAAAGDIGAFNSALALYQVDVAGKQFPQTTLLQLLSDSAVGWSGPYVATIAPDPWGNNYAYASDGINYTIMCVRGAAENQTATVRYVFATGEMEFLPPPARDRMRLLVEGVALALLALLLVVARRIRKRVRRPLHLWLTVALIAGFIAFVAFIVPELLTAI